MDNLRRCGGRRGQPSTIAIVLGTRTASSTLIHARALCMLVDKDRSTILDTLLIPAGTNDQTLFELSLELDSAADVVRIRVRLLTWTDRIGTVLAPVDAICVACPC